MEITLAQAIRLRNLLATVVIPVESIMVVVNSDDGIDEKAIEEQNAKFIAYMIKTQTLIEHHFALRDLIQLANFGTGISKILLDIAEAEAHCKNLEALITKVLSNAYGASNRDAVQAAINHKKEMAKHGPEYMSGRQNYSLVAVDKEKILETLQEAVASKKFKIQEFQDKRNAINMKTVIKLPEAMVDFLREISLLPKA